MFPNQEFNNEVDFEEDEKDTLKEENEMKLVELEKVFGTDRKVSSIQPVNIHCCLF